jgi:hypothetical protein
MTSKKDSHEQVEIPARQPPDFQPSIRLVVGVRACIRPFDSRRHEVCNVARPIRGESAGLMLSEITRVCETTEREMEDGSDLDLGQCQG